MDLEFAPRLSPRLLAAIARFDDPRLPIAEVARRVGRRASELGLPRPSYERVRVLVHRLRRARWKRAPSTASVLIEVALGLRPPQAIVAHLAGGPLPP